VFVSPADSLQETFGITLIEAMATGRPVIASDWNGYRDIVVHGETGILVPTMMPKYSRHFDDVRGSGYMHTSDLLSATTIVDVPSLISAIEALLGSAELRFSMGSAGQRRARALYDWPVVVGQYEQVWDDSADQSRRRALPSLEPTSRFDQQNYMHVFGHFATQLLSDHTQVSISTYGLACMQRFELLGALAKPATWFSPELLLQVLSVAAQSDVTTVAEIASRLMEGRDLQTDRAAAHVWRLAKCGALELRMGTKNEIFSGQ